MGFLDKLRSSESNQVEHWTDLTDVHQLEEIDQVSNTRPVVIFKHSTTCGISAGAKFRLEAEWEDVAHDHDFYYLDLLTFRPISNAVAEKYQVRHESPQILIIRNGMAIYHTSHHRITKSSVQSALESAE